MHYIDNPSPVFAVTGATGQLGRLAVGELLRRGVPPSSVVAVSRSVTRADDLRAQGVQIRVADYGNPEALRVALSGVDRLLLVSSSDAASRVAHHANVIDAARVAGVSRIAYTSMLNADTTTNPLAGDHQQTERLLLEAGIPVTLLRNGWYTENYTDQLSRYLESGTVLGAAANGRISAASRRDFAAAGAVALLRDGPAARTYELGGRAFDLTELARVISEVTASTVIYRDLSAEQYVGTLQQAGLDESTARFVAALDTSIAAGDLETDSDDLVQLIGRPATTLRDVVAAAQAGLDLAWQAADTASR